MIEYHHTTVLLHEAIEALNIKPDGVYVDCTLGGGGHTKAILDKLGAHGKLFVFDHDSDAWPNAPQDNRVILVKENFQYIYKFLKHLKAIPVDGILADLGVSSHHFDTSTRGFSIRENGPLDMRMDTRLEKTAATILNNFSESELVEIFSKYGEVENSKTLAATIVDRREGIQLHTIEQFVAMISDCIRQPQNKYLAKVFQSLRIEVNEELKVLKVLLEESHKCLHSNGRLVIISFHSLEDRLVKEYSKPRIISEDIMTGKVEKEILYKPINKLPTTPTDKEIKHNSRSRSAKMRVLEKV